MNDPKKSATSCADEAPSTKSPADKDVEPVISDSGEKPSDTDIDKSILKEIKDILGDVRGLVQKHVSVLEKSTPVPSTSRVRLEFEEKEGNITMSRCEIVPLRKEKIDWGFWVSLGFIIVVLALIFIGVCWRISIQETTRIHMSEKSFQFHDLPSSSDSSNSVERVVVNSNVTERTIVTTNRYTHWPW